MADDANNLGDLNISITGDDSDLQSALDDAISSAQSAGDQVAEAFKEAANATDLAGGSLNIYQQALAALQGDGESVQTALQMIADSAGSLGDDVSNAARSVLDDMTPAVEDLGNQVVQTQSNVEELDSTIRESGQDAESAASEVRELAEGFAVLGESLVITEGLKEFGEEALTTFGTVQSVTIGLTQLTGSVEQATEAVENIKQLAATEPFAFPDIAPTAQKMVALGISIEQLPAAMQAAGDAAAATGNSFSAVANAIDRMSLSGKAAQRQLVALGISTTDLANAMGVTADQVTDAFAALDQSERVDALTTALQKFGGAAIAQAQGIAGQWQIFQNQFEEVMVAIGADIAPVVSALLDFGKSAMAVVQQAAEAFQLLPRDMQTGIVAVGLLVGALVPLTAGLAAVGFGIQGLTTLVETLGIATVAEAGAEGTAAIATAAHGAAAAEAAIGVEALTVAEGEANAVIGVQMGLFGQDTVLMGTAATQMTLFGEATATAAVDTGILGTALGGAVGGFAAVAGGIVTLVGQFSDLKEAATTNGEAFQSLIDYGKDLIGANDGLAGSFDNLQAVVMNLSEAVSQNVITWGTLWDAIKFGTGPVGSLAETWKAASSDINDAISAITNKFPTMDAAVQHSLQVAQSAAAAMSEGLRQVGTSFDSLSSGAQSVIDHVAQLNKNVSDGKVVLQQLKDASDGSAASLQAIAAQSVSVATAEKALTSALGENVKAMKDAGDSMADLADSTQTAQAKFDNANTTWANFMTALNDGKSTIDGVAITANNANIAWNNLAAAYLKATGAVLQWNAAAGNTGQIIQNQVNSYTNLKNAVDQTQAALVAQQAAYQQALADGTATEQMYAQLVISYNAAQKASEALTKATDQGSASTDDITGKIQDYVTIIANGKTLTAAYTQAQLDDAEAADDLAKAFGITGTAVQDLINKYNQAIAAEQGNEQGIRNLTSATNDADAAQKKIAADIAANNKAWADGKIVVSAYGDALSQIEDAGTKADGTLSDLNQKLLDEADAAADAQGAAQSYTQQLQALADAANEAADAVSNLDSAQSKSSAGRGSSSGGGSLNEVLSAAIAIGQSASTGGALGGGGVGQGYIDQMAQELADSTGQVVTTLDGMFIPAATRAAEEATALAAVQAAATAAQTANTTAVTASTTATVAATDALTAAQQSYVDSAAAGDAIVTSFSSLPQTIQDFLTSVGGTLVAYDDTTGALQYTEKAANGLTETLNSSVAANEIAAASTTTAASATVSALTTVAQAAQGVSNGITALGTVTAQTSQAIATAATAITAIAGYVAPAALLTSASSAAGSFSGSAAGSAFSFTPFGSYVDPNPGLGVTIPGFGQQAQGGNGSNGTVVNLTMNITGNMVASDQSIQQLASKVSSAAITQLRTFGGLKL